MHVRRSAVVLVVALAASACGENNASGPTPTAQPSATAPSATPSPSPERRAPATRLSCPPDLVPVTIVDRYRDHRPPGTPQEALVQQLNSRSYEEGSEEWTRPRQFERIQAGARAVRYLARREDGSVGLELRVERQARPAGWTPTQRQSCEPPRTPPTVLQAMSDPGPDPSITCDPGYRAGQVVAGRRPDPGASSAIAALRRFLELNGGRLSGDERLREHQFIRLAAERGRPGSVRFAARRADGSWAAVVSVERSQDRRWRRGSRLGTCVQNAL